MIMEQISHYIVSGIRDRLWSADYAFGPLFDYYFEIGDYLSCWEPQYKVKGRLGGDLFWEFYEY